MFSKRKIKKICRSFKSPDISDRIPELLSPDKETEKRGKKYSINLSRIALPIALILLFTFMAVIPVYYLRTPSYHTNDNDSNIGHGSVVLHESVENHESNSSTVVESTTDEPIESSKDNRQIIYGKYIGVERSEAFAEDGGLLIEELYLAKALEEHEDEDVLFGVYIHLEGTTALKIPTACNDNLSDIKEQYQKNKYVFEGIYAHFETFGVVIEPISPEECLHLYARPYTVYRARLTAEQIHSLRNTNYGVFITFSDEESNFYQE